jgi:filamentous hemagglutinin family protein
MNRSMFRTNAARRPVSSRLGRLMTGASAAAIACTIGLVPVRAYAQEPFATMVQMQTGKVIGANGQLSQWTGAAGPVIGKDADGRPLMTIQQTQAKALLDWEDFRLQTNEILHFQQQSADWIAVNRVHGAQASRIDGEIRAIGKVFVFNDNGVLIGDGARINVRQLVTGKGFSDVLVNGSTTTLVQSAEKATLDWSNMSLQAGEALKFQQEKSSWIALNRSYNAATTVIDGDISANGHLYLVAPAGLAINGDITAQQVVLSSLYMRDDQFAGSAGGQGGLMSYLRSGGRRDPTFSNTWYYPGDTVGDWIGKTNYYGLMLGGPQASDPNDPLRYNVTIGRTGSVTTGALGKVMLFGPNVTNKGLINVQDEGQVILAAGENIYLAEGLKGMLEAYVGAYNPLSMPRTYIAYEAPPRTIASEDWRAFYGMLLGKTFKVGDTLSAADYSALYVAGTANGNTTGGLIGRYVNRQQAIRASTIGYTARNEGIITAKRGGSIDFRGLNLEQMGAIEMTSTALFRGAIGFHATVWDWWEDNEASDSGFTGQTLVAGNGNVVFGAGSLTQITPDLDSKDTIPVSDGVQSVGTLKVNAGSLHMRDDSLIYMPSGTMRVLLDSGTQVFDNNRGTAGNQGNEDGTRFLMEDGATIDLSGWKSSVLAMGYHQVAGRLFAAELADSPVQQGGPLARKEIIVDRRYGTDLANWENFDNLTQGTLAQFLTDGGMLSMDISDDMIMKPGSVIDVSGGITTYEAGFVKTTLLRRLDGTVIDIREADPDELYMGLANEWVQYDTKWGEQTTYYIPLLSSYKGQYESSYVQGGAAGSIKILAPDAVLMGTVKGETTAGRYQRGNLPAAGSFLLNYIPPQSEWLPGDPNDSEKEYVSNRIVIADDLRTLTPGFGLNDKLSDLYGTLFGDEFDAATDPAASDIARKDNATLASASFFNNSSMGFYSLSQRDLTGSGLPLDGPAVYVDANVSLDLQNGADFRILADQRMSFLGSIRTEGGDVTLKAMSLTFGDTTRFDTRGGWYSDYELGESVPLAGEPRYDGGFVHLTASADETLAGLWDIGLVMPEGMTIDTSGGGWVNREGVLTAGLGGDVVVEAHLYSPYDALDLSGLWGARAYGLGGNGALILHIPDPIFIGQALPEGADNPGGRPSLLLTPEFFENSGFRTIALVAPGIAVLDGVQVNATGATLALRDATLIDGVPAAFKAPTGTDIYDIAEVKYLPPAQRLNTPFNGLNLTFWSSGSYNYIGEGSRVATELGGKIELIGSTLVAGTVYAPAGEIALGGFTGIGGSRLAAGAGPDGVIWDEGPANDDISVYVTSTGKLLAPGISLVAWHDVDSNGGEQTDGLLFGGGTISLIANSIRLDAGAVLDVAGVQATFDRPVQADGGTILAPTILSSAGGAIGVQGVFLDINDASYFAQAGGTGARGGTFDLLWGAGYSGGGSSDGPEATITQFEEYFTYDIFLDDDWNPVTTFYGTDLSTINWENSIGIPLEFPEGYVVHSRAELLAAINDYAVAALGRPPALVIGDPIPLTGGGAAPASSLAPALIEVLNALFGYQLPAVNTADPIVTYLSTDRIAAGGFAQLRINTNAGIVFSGDVNLGGTRADGSYVFDNILINAATIMGADGANVHLAANFLNLGGGPGGVVLDAYKANMIWAGVKPVGADSTIEIKTGTLLQAAYADFYGFSQVDLVSGGDIRFDGRMTEGAPGPIGSLNASGLLRFKADQVYAASGRIFDVVSSTGIEILAQDDGGPINASPYEAAATLTLTAPRIVQSGTLRSPLGTLNLNVYDDGTEGSNVLTLRAGSITSVSAEGRVIPYGFTSNGDTWINPFTGQELKTLPSKTIAMSGGTIDLQAGSVVNIAGGGDLYAHEFVQGTGGSYDWLTGYRDADFNWIADPSGIYAVLPDFEGDIAPLGFGASAINPGTRVYLPGGSGLAAGYYFLLPSEYALLPGAFRVTLNHRENDTGAMAVGEVRGLTDGSSIQAGFLTELGSGLAAQNTLAFHVMPGATLRARSFYIETYANTYFASEAYLKKAERINRPLGDLPPRPMDGGSLSLSIGTALNLNGTLNSGAIAGGRDGLFDIASEKMVVAGANTDLSLYDGYVVLDSDQLNGFGAESLLIGGVRTQGADRLTLDVLGTDIVVDNIGSTLTAPEILLASAGNLDILAGSSLVTSGQISGASSDIYVQASVARFVDSADVAGRPHTTIVNEALDQGALLRLSSGDQVDIIRDGGAVTAMNALRTDPVALAAVNAARAKYGLAPVDVTGGLLTIADGVTLSTSRSLAMDATLNTLLDPGATLNAEQISASSSRISIGAVPAGTQGLVFSGESFQTLTSAIELTLKSYSSIDLYGAVALKTTEALRLDTGELKLIGANAPAASITAKTLTLTNSQSGTAAATAGTGSLTLNATNLYLEGADKALSGIAALAINATERVIGRDEGTLYVPGSVALTAGTLTAESGARLLIDATGSMTVGYNGNAGLPVFEAVGGTVGLSAASLSYGGNIRMTGGTVTLAARDGDLTLNAGSKIDVTGGTAVFFDVSQGIPAGTVNLISDRGDIDLAAGAVVDVSGAAVGGDAGTLNIVTGLGEARLGGTILGGAATGSRSGSFSILTQSLADFAGFNAVLDAAGFRQARRFEVNSGDVVINRDVKVQEFGLVANNGSVTLQSTIETTGDNGGHIQLSAAEDVTLASGARLLARANTVDGSGGTVVLETAGRDGGLLSLDAGSLIDVSGTGIGGRTVRLRAPQIGGDVAIGSVSGTIVGATSVVAEAYRVYDGVAVIDRPLIDRVSADATGFMAANAAAIRARLGTAVTLVAGIELRNDGDMTLATNWDLSGLRFDGMPGALVLRAAGDLTINANLTDGFVGTQLMAGDSWSYTLTAGANLASPDSTAVLPIGLLGADAGSLVIGGTPDTIEYFYDPARANDTRLYRLAANGSFARVTNSAGNYHIGFVELTRDRVTGKYIDPVTGKLIEKDPVTGQYVDTATYARRPLPWILYTAGGGFTQQAQNGTIQQNSYLTESTVRQFQQWDNATGYLVRTGTGSITLAAGRDVILKERPSVVYTAGKAAPALSGFYAPPGAQYGTGGGDLSVRAGGDIVSSSATVQMPNGYLRQRLSTNTSTGLFATAADRAFDQTTWWVDYESFQGGIGALGGGNIVIAADGDIDNLGVAIPTTGRVTGGTVLGEATELHETGGGDLTLTAGGNIAGGAFYVGDGLGLITAGGALTAGSKVHLFNYTCLESGGTVLASCNIHYDPNGRDISFDLYPMLFTSSGQFDVRSNGDLNIEGVLDPVLLGASTQRNVLSGPDPVRRTDFVTFTDTASVRLFSAGGNVTAWNNGLNMRVAYFNSILNPLKYLWTDVNIDGLTSQNGLPTDSPAWQLRPAEMTAIAATGDVRILGSMTMMPSATGNLTLLAGDNVYIGYGSEAGLTAKANQGITPPVGYAGENANYRSSTAGLPGVTTLVMSQSDMKLIRTPTNLLANPVLTLSDEVFRNAGGVQGDITLFSRANLPDLHVGDTDPVRIYAVDGDIVTGSVGTIVLPKMAWLQAGDDIYFPSLLLQHNSGLDLSLLRAGDGIYFDKSVLASSALIQLSGPGRLEVEAGGDIYMPDNVNGITSRRIPLYAVDAGNLTSTSSWKPTEAAADIAISAGYNQTPSYQAFEDAYLSPETVGGMKDFVLEEETGKSLYLFDRDYARAEGATGDFATPEPREGLVNYVRRLQNLAPLATKAEEVAYLDTAWAYWKGLSTDYKTPFYRSILFLEMRTSGREANDPKSDRFGTAERGYFAIAALFPGAEKDLDEALAAGESRWNGDFETYASRVMSFGGGKIEFVLPGGRFEMANVAASNDQTGQPSLAVPRGNAFRAGVITADGGEVNILTHDNMTLNNSRLLTTKGGNIMIWASYGDIAAGKGAKTAISPQFYDYTLDIWARAGRNPAGLPTGAGIGTLATQEGVRGADVDLVAPEGIVDAGDAGIRVSGNFNVFAVEVLGLDNIEVAGVSTGLPIPPAAPPTSLDTGELAAKSNFIEKALDDAIAQVRVNNAILSPSLIEVRVTGYGNLDGCRDDDDRTDNDCEPDRREITGPVTAVAVPTIAAVAEPGKEGVLEFETRVVDFDIPQQPLDEAIRAVGRISGFNILYETADVVERVAPVLAGRMTPEQALERLLAGQKLTPVRVGPRTITLKKIEE